MAATAVQGLANRDSARVFLQTVDANWMVTFKHKDIVHTSETLRKYRSVDDAWKEYYATKRGLQFEPKHYVAFMVNEGDTMKCAGTMMMCGSWLEPERGRLPINWGISPYLCEQFPGMMEFYYSTMTANDYLFDGPGGYGYMAPKFLPKDVLMPFAERTRQGNVTADTRISDLWYFYPLAPDDLRNRWLAAMGLAGLTQWRGPQRVIYPAGCPPIIDSPHYYDKATPEELATQLISESEKSPRPWFTVVYAGDPHRFWEVSRRLPPEQFKIVRLDELFIAAAKSRQTVEGRIVKPVDAR